ncbi:MAG: hypothetical protein F6K32_10945 [Desertifilum sp. SIO1I2]|nr:hypothetical protein [Desertifilum sp. SIO1I2]
MDDISFKGGRGKKLPPGLRSISWRIPEGARDSISFLCDAYRSGEWDGTLESLGHSQTPGAKELLEEAIALLEEVQDPKRYVASKGGAIRDKAKDALVKLLEMRSKL